MSGYDLLIRSGTVIDGTGRDRYVADLAIRDGKIVYIADRIAGEAKRVLDAAGKIVAPGVIDPHTHYDAQINWDPYCTNSGWHGNTSFIVGNCGFGFMPCRASDRERYMQMMEATEQIPVSTLRTALPWTWETFPEWMAHMRNLPKGVNIAAFMPVNSLLIYVMGYEAAKSRPATEAEKAEMVRLFNEALDAGAIGFGLSHLYEFNSHKDSDGSPMPSDTMHIPDLYPLAEVLRERGYGAIQFLGELPAVSNREQMEELARISGRPLLHNIVMAFDALPDYHREVLKWLDSCAERGLDIYSQALALRLWNEFTIDTTNGWDVIEIFRELTMAGDTAAKVAKAADPDYRARLRNEYRAEDLYALGGSIETYGLVRMNSPAPEWDRYIGMTFAQIAAERGGTAVDCLMDAVVASEGKVEFRTTEMPTQDTKKLLEIFSHPRTIGGTSDGGAHVKSYSGGQWATDNIMQMVRETGLMTLEQLHYKFSKLPAHIFGFENRGTLEVGQWADLYIYDYDKLNYNQDAYEILHDLPGGEWRRVARAQGIDYCVVNGEVTMVNGVETGAVPGRIVASGGRDALYEQNLLEAAE